MNSLKQLFSWIWRPATAEEKIIKRYDILIALCVVFMIGYICIFFVKIQNQLQENSAMIVENQLATNDPDYNDTLFLSTNMVIPSVVSVSPDKSLPPNEFFVGEIIGIKYFGTFGLIEEKILGTEGYKYKVRWKDISHDLPTDEFYGWELYRPDKHSVPLSSLQN